MADFFVTLKIHSKVAYSLCGWVKNTDATFGCVFRYFSGIFKVRCKGGGCVILVAHSGSIHRQSPFFVFLARLDRGEERSELGSRLPAKACVFSLEAKEREKGATDCNSRDRLGLDLGSTRKFWDFLFIRT
jgi:hypothetical protein